MARLTCVEVGVCFGTPWMDISRSGDAPVSEKEKGKRGVNAHLERCL